LESLHCAELEQPPATTLLHVPPGAPTHVSVVAAFPSLQFPFELQQPAVGAYQLVHVPLTQASPVQASPSVHAFELSLGCVQLPPPHTSSVQGLPSSVHGAELFVKTQPLAGLQESSVHALESLHVMVVPEHVPPLHTSPVVHALPSLQEAPLFPGVCTQAFETHESTAQGLESAHSPSVRQQPGTVEPTQVGAT
jgi:hypothetical protein